MREIDVALRDYLLAGTALTALLTHGSAIYNRRAPQGVSPPYLVFFESAGVDDNDSPRRARTATYTIKAISTDQDEALLIEAALDARLESEPDLALTSWGNYRTKRLSDINYAEEGAGVEYHHVGGQWQFRIAK